MGVIAAHIFCNPIFFGSTCFVFVLLELGFPGAWGIALCLVCTALLSGAGACALYRWCFYRPAVRGLGLLVSGVTFVGMVTMPSFLDLARAWLGATPAVGAMQFSVWISETLVFMGLLGAILMFSALALEIPVRWAIANTCVVDDGVLRALRWIATLLVLVAGNVVLREEAWARLKTLCEGFLV